MCAQEKTSSGTRTRVGLSLQQQLVLLVPCCIEEIQQGTSQMPVPPGLCGLACTFLSTCLSFPSSASKEALAFLWRVEILVVSWELLG